MLNSVIISSTVTLDNVLIASMAGYVLARQRLMGSNLVFLLVLASQMVPYQLTLIPVYILIRNLQLLNTHLGIILPLVGSGIIGAFGIFVMRQYILTIPIEYEESARIDGCSTFGVFFRVILPLCKPALVVVAVTSFIESWNNFIIPLVMVTRSPMKTVTLGIADFSLATLNVNWGATMAASLLGLIPSLVIFLLLSRYLLHGLTLYGGIKI